MQSDRELLELAAKAAGYELKGFDVMRALVVNEHGHTIGWNPLTDDGDALRLAVKLGLDLCVSPNFRLCAWSDAASDWMEEAPGNDPCSAMRRAIVRAAAAIGGA